MAFMVVSSLTFTSHHSSDVVALLFYLGLLLWNRYTVLYQFLI